MRLDQGKFLVKGKPTDLLWQTLDHIYPPFCCHCGQLGHEICPGCLEVIELLDQSKYCEKCGQLKHKVGNCDIVGLHFDRIHSWGLYTGSLRSIVQKLKYDRGVGLAKYLVPQLCSFISSRFTDFDAIIALPLGKKRELSRGYNQTALFAKPLAKVLGSKYLPAAVERSRETISQVGLSAKERKTNILDAFKADGKIVGGLRILLMDDITTTGATINECAKSLKLAGAAKVYCFTLAKAKNLI